MAFCSKCGNKLSDGVKFCNMCGTPVCSAPAAPSAEPAAAPAAEPAAAPVTTPSAEPAAAPATAPAAAPAAAKKKTDFGALFGKLNNGADHTSEMDGDDIEKNKLTALLAFAGVLIIMPLPAFDGWWYLLGILLSALCLIPLLTNKDSKFIRFNLNQGALVILAALAWRIVRFIIGLIISLIFRLIVAAPMVLGVIASIIFGFVEFILNLTYIVIPLLAFIGVVNAVSGKAKDLPIIGKLRIFK